MTFGENSIMGKCINREEAMKLLTIEYKETGKSWAVISRRIHPLGWQWVDAPTLRLVCKDQISNTIIESQWADACKLSSRIIQGSVKKIRSRESVLHMLVEAYMKQGKSWEELSVVMCFTGWTWARNKTLQLICTKTCIQYISANNWKTACVLAENKASEKMDLTHLKTPNVKPLHIDREEALKQLYVLLQNKVEYWSELKTQKILGWKWLSVDTEGMRLYPDIDNTYVGNPIYRSDLEDYMINQQTIITPYMPNLTVPEDLGAFTPIDSIVPIVPTPVDCETVRKHSHYFKDCPFNEIDVYRMLRMFVVTDPALAHAIKKLLVPGGRGGNKDNIKDVQEAVDTLVRWIEMEKEDKAHGVNQPKD